MTIKKLRIPITNVYAKGDFTLQMAIGSGENIVNLLLDTGSSTLAISSRSYQAEKDTSLSTTTYAQEIIYGLGGWIGPVVTVTTLLMGEQQQLEIANTHIALASDDQQSFGHADGILGLAYHHLNRAYDLSKYYTDNQKLPVSTFPWIFAAATTHQQLSDFKQFLKGYPEKDIVPYFTELESHHLAANQFAFSVRRSSIHWQSAQLNDEELIKDPLNQGVFILGESSDETDLYQGEFESIKVLHDIYYNTNLTAIQVEGDELITAPQLDQQYQKSYFTNAIVDTGASGIILTNELYQSLLSSFNKINPLFKKTLESYPPFNGTERGISMDMIKLEQWPPIHFYFEGVDGKPIKLTCTAQTYWQTNAPLYGQISFKIIPQLPTWPNQSIFGLPLLSNYYTIFDRSIGPTGVIKFARQQT